MAEGERENGGKREKDGSGGENWVARAVIPKPFFYSKPVYI